MDNKITKKRLSDFLSYEWIIMLIVAVVSILGWEFIYHVGSVQLTTGQSFKYFYDETVVSISNSELVRGLMDKNTFSYDVVKLNTEMLDAENNILGTRLTIQDGDVMFTDLKGDGETVKDSNGVEKPVTVRAKAHVDSTAYVMYALDDMLADAKTYLKDNFIKDGQEISKDNVDDAKLEATFRTRMKGDNRFRTEENIQKGIKKERERIEKLCENVEFFEGFISNPKYQDALFKYTRYSQKYSLATTEEDKAKYQEWMKYEEGKIYAINIGVLDEIGAGVDATKILQLREPKEGDKLSKDVVLMVFDFKEYQPHLQYESLSFVCSTIQMLLGN